MATEIKNRMGPLQQGGANPTAVRIGPSHTVQEKKSGGCC